MPGQGNTIVMVEDTDTYDGKGGAPSGRFTSDFGLSGCSGTYTEVDPGRRRRGEAAIDVEVARPASLST